MKVLSRSGHIMTGSYPELAGLAEQLAVPVLLDGELVVLDEHGRPSFALHQHRMHVRAPSPGLLREVPVQF